MKRNIFVGLLISVFSLSVFANSEDELSLSVDLGEEKIIGLSFCKPEGDVYEEVDNKETKKRNDKTLIKTDIGIKIKKMIGVNKVLENEAILFNLETEERVYDLFEITSADYNWEEKSDNSLNENGETVYTVPVKIKGEGTTGVNRSSKVIETVLVCISEIAKTAKDSDFYELYNDEKHRYCINKYKSAGKTVRNNHPQKTLSFRFKRFLSGKPQGGYVDKNNLGIGESSVLGCMKGGSEKDGLQDWKLVKIK